MFSIQKTILLFLIINPLIVIASEGNPSLAMVTKTIEHFVKNRAQTNDQVNISIVSNTNLIPKNLPTLLSVSCHKTGPIYGRTIFFIKYKNMGRQWKTFQIVAEVERFDDVLILKENVDRNQIITEDLVTTGLRSVNWAKREKAVSMNEALGKRTKRMLIKGRVLFESMLEKAPVVERGQLATLIVYSKNMSITMPVVACENAGIGQEIKVKNESTDKYYRAIVQDDGTVILRL